MRFHIIIQIGGTSNSGGLEFTRHFKRLSEARQAYEDLLEVASVSEMWLYDIREATPLQSFARLSIAG